MASVASPNSVPSSLNYVSRALLFFGAIGVAFFLYRYGSPYAGGADSSGYLNSAKLLEHHNFLGTVRTPAGQGVATFSRGAFQPLGFNIEPKFNHMTPTYPIGLPLHLLMAAKIAGWERAALLVNIFSVVGSGIVLWLLARHFNFSDAWAALAVGWFWLCPQVLFSGLQPMSDSPALFWSLFCVYAAVKGRTRPSWHFICGFSLAVAVLVRPTNALLLLPTLIGIGFRPVNLGLFILGGLPGAALLGYYNFHVYGAVLATGYGDILSSFNVSFLKNGAVNMGRWIPDLLSPLICVGLALPFVRGSWSRDALVLAIWAVTLGGFYAFYYNTSETWWYLRFILPTFPILILAAVSVLRRWPANRPPAPLLLVVALGAFVGIWEYRLNQQLSPVTIAQNERTYRLASDWAKTNLPPTSAVYCMQVSGAFYFYTDFLLIRWDQIEPAYIDDLSRVLQDQHRPIYAVLYDFESKNALERIGGKWSKLATIGLASVWQQNN